MVNSKKIRNFKDLKICQESVEFVEEIYRITKKFPGEELYGIALRYSVPYKSQVHF
ncbi:MAG: hypothetical protein DRH33_06720 [Candidatus Nealsonbacteria bacterium]|nr:MAG: hypothetical protein DRH33_06720 [Candidatus Nealsonbacteria bacterium]